MSIKHAAAAIALAASVVVGVGGAAQADDPPCVTLVVAGECVSQPVADFVLGQQQTIAGLTATHDSDQAALIQERAAHQQTRLLLTEAQAQVDYLQTELAQAQARLIRKQLTIERLREVIRERG